MTRRVGRFTKHETAELSRMFSEGISVYSICKNLNRSQKSIRNNLIKLGLIEGEITPRCYTSIKSDILVNDRIVLFVWNYISNTFIILFLSLIFVINPNLNILEIVLSYIYFIWL